MAVALIAFAGTGTGELGLGNPDIQKNVFMALAEPILGPLALLVSLAVLSSSTASLQSTFVSPARTMLAMGHYGALPASFARIHPRFLTPGYAVLVSSVVASTFYAVMRFISENVLWDTITALGMMICFYYGLTAFASVWYFRTQFALSARNFVFMFLAPLIGGFVLLVVFFQTLFDSMDPDYGSGSAVGGVGLVFLLGMAVLLSGVGIMLYQRARMPGFFRGETITQGVSDGQEDMTVTLPE
jgi:amino acid transporter